MKRIDTAEEERFLKAAIYGKSGTGKTSLGVTCPKPLILASERQAVLSIRQAAKRMGIDTPSVLHMQTVEDYRAILRALHGAKDQPFTIKNGDDTLEMEWPETVVLDSLTDAGRLIWDEILATSPPEEGKDGLPAVSMRHWGVVNDKVTNLILAFRDAPVNVLYLCLSDDREVGEGKQKTRDVKPALPTRRLSDTLCAAANVVGHAYRTQNRQGDTVFATMFQGPEYFMLKQCVPLRDRERSNFAAWHDAIFKHIAPTDEAPEASYESVTAHTINDTKEANDAEA